MIIKKIIAKMSERTGVFLYRRGYWLINQSARVKNNGEHPKHSIMQYHEFFVKNSKKTDSVLDVGCGDGYVSWHVAAKAQEVVGIDMKKSSIQRAKKKYHRKNLSYIIGDATKKKFTKTFDVIILSNVLEHIQDRVGLLKQLPQAQTYLIRVPLITRDWLAVYMKEQGYDYRLDRTHELEYTEELICKELHEAGLKVVSQTNKWGETYVVAKR